LSKKKHSTPQTSLKIFIVIFVKEKSLMKDYLKLKYLL